MCFQHSKTFWPKKQIQGNRPLLEYDLDNNISLIGPLNKISNIFNIVSVSSIQTQFSAPFLQKSKEIWIKNNFVSLLVGQLIYPKKGLYTFITNIY